ncbi:BPSS1780 family membrane protein [Chitinolyticbacter meiyuanensis]|uniref:BPSS1780 family membrane protein n=1 Tax=Chitinolyticbacter meiyuanensis TaxID=682798 RepID=UPI0011E59979|nr:BPSS1780 family membrane protein [Chitinolyticbacter meiyuanensis]
MQDLDAVIDMSLEPRRINPTGCIRWLKDAWMLFSVHGLTWSTMFWLMFLMVLFCMFIPLLGTASSLLNVMLFGGLIASIDAARNGKKLELGGLFVGFKHSLGELLLTGVLLLAVSISTLFVLFVIMIAIGSPYLLMITKGQLTPELLKSPEIAAGVLAVMLTCGLVVQLVNSAFMYAPMLVVLRRFKAMDAMKLSVVACCRNILPFSLLALICLPVLLLVPLTFGLALLVLMPFAALVSYTSFIDIFGEGN